MSMGFFAGAFGSRAETPHRSSLPLCSFFLTILGMRICLERFEQTSGYVGYLTHGSFEGGLIALRRFGKPADLAHELQRGGANLFFSDGRVKVEKWLDVPAHKKRFAPPLCNSCARSAGLPNRLRAM